LETDEDVTRIDRLAVIFGVFFGLLYFVIDQSDRPLMLAGLALTGVIWLFAYGIGWATKH